MIVNGSGRATLSILVGETFDDDDDSRARWIARVSPDGSEISAFTDLNDHFAILSGGQPVDPEFLDGFRLDSIGFVEVEGGEMVLYGKETFRSAIYIFGENGVPDLEADLVDFLVVLGTSEGALDPTAGAPALPGGRILVFENESDTFLSLEL